MTDIVRKDPLIRVSFWRRKAVKWMTNSAQSCQTPLDVFICRCAATGPLAQKISSNCGGNSELVFRFRTER